MIKVTVKLKDNTYDDNIELFYTNNVGMEKIDNGVFYSDDDVLVKCYFAFKALMSKQWFRDNVVEYSQDTDGEIADLVQDYYQLKSEGLI